MAQSQEVFEFNLSVKGNPACAFPPQESWSPQPFSLAF